MTKAMASAAPTRPVSALETMSRPGGISGMGAVSIAGSPLAASALAVSALAASPILSRFGCVASSMAPVPGSPRFMPWNGSWSAVLTAPILTGPTAGSLSSGGGGGGGLDRASAACGSLSAGGGGGSLFGGGGGRDAFGGGGGRDGGGSGASSTSRSMLSKFGIGFAAAALAAADGAGGFEGVGALSGASPVSSDMPKRSSACSRRAAPLAPPRLEAEAGRAAGGGGAGRGGAGGRRRPVRAGPRR